MIAYERIEEIEDELQENTEEGADGFAIVSDLQAEWALKRIKKAREEKERLINIATAEIKELTEKIENLEAKTERENGYLKKLLFDYFSRVEHKESKTQETYKLLSGSLVFKKPTQKMEPNREKLLEYVKANNMPEFVKTKEDIDWAAYKKECEIVDGKVVNTQTGDLLPEDLIEVQDVPGEFDVKL